MQSLTHAPDGAAEQACRRYSELWHESLEKLAAAYPAAQVELAGTDYQRDLTDHHKRMLNLARYYINDIAAQKNLQSASVGHEEYKAKMLEMQQWYLERSQEQTELFTQMLARTEGWLKDVKFKQDEEAAAKQKAYYKDLFLNWQKENEEDQAKLHQELDSLRKQNKETLLAAAARGNTPTTRSKSKAMKSSLSEPCCDDLEECD